MGSLGKPNLLFGSGVNVPCMYIVFVDDFAATLAPTNCCAHFSCLKQKNPAEFDCAHVKLHQHSSKSKSKSKSKCAHRTDQRAKNFPFQDKVSPEEGGPTHLWPVNQLAS